MEPDQEETPPPLTRSKSSGGIYKAQKVWLHIYHLNQATEKLNTALLKPMGVGAFHVGVEVLGDEWYFRWADSTESGVVWMRPRAHQVHVYAESICLGSSMLTEPRIRSVLGDFVDSWLANSYHPVSRNCNHFAKAFVEALRCTEPFPDWVIGLSDAVESSYIAPVLDRSWDWLKWWNTSAACNKASSAWACEEEIEEVTQMEDL
mmetsp:Transcript_72974/g.171041  ORF Transcript_72974/g.171041 Transcript_72974/m.171041 type:complete len:205 (+) Transcript_72974:77-691(+)